MTLLFCLALLLGNVAEAPSQPPTPAQQLQSLNEQINKLQIDLEAHAKQSEAYRREGDRWRFSTGRVEEAYSYWQKADDEGALMIQDQQQLEALYAKREEFYLAHPELRPPA